MSLKFVDSLQYSIQANGQQPMVKWHITVWKKNLFKKSVSILNVLTMSSPI